MGGHKIERVHSGVSTWVYRIEVGGQRYYLRILPEVGETFGAEVAVHQLAREAGARVPEVLHYEPHNPTAGRSIMLTAEMPGRPLDRSVSKGSARDVIREAGRDLARINSTSVRGFGRISQVGSGTDFIGEYPDLPSLIDGEYVPHIEHLGNGEIGRHVAEKLHVIVNHGMASLDGNPAYLVHGDFDTSHIFWDGLRYQGIIDFGEIRVMPGMYDLGHHWMHDRERLPYSTMPWLLEGYAEIVPIPNDVEDQIRFWSVLIAARALSRGVRRSATSQIVKIARSALSRDLAHVTAFR